MTSSPTTSDGKSRPQRRHQRSPVALIEGETPLPLHESQQTHQTERTDSSLTVPTENAARKEDTNHDEDRARVPFYHRSQTLPPRLEENKQGSSSGTPKFLKMRSRLMVESMLPSYKKQTSKDEKKEEVPVDNRSVEEKRLNRIVTETGQDAWGVDAVEVWFLQHGSLLIRPDGGYWRNPEMVMDEFLSRLEDPSNPMHEPAEPVSVGVDLPGHLWAESMEGGGMNLSGRGGNLFGRATPSPSGSQRGGSIFGSSLFAKARAPASESGSGRGGKVFSGGSLHGADVFASLSKAMGGSATPTNDAKAPDANLDAAKPKHRRINTWSGAANRSFDSRKKQLRIPKFRGTPKNDLDEDQLHPRLVLSWRDINALVENPDLPKTPRLLLLHNAGFNYAAGVPFHSGGRQGLVIFLSQLQEDAEQLYDYPNQVLMIRAAESIGSVLASNEARLAAMAVRPVSMSEYLHIDTGKDDVSEDLMNESSNCTKAKKRATMWSRKCRGGNLQIPPAMTLRQSLWTLLGCFSGLLLISGLNDVIRTESSGDLFFVMGPIGALMALQYGLTAAPASQPRNAILGQALAGAISLAISHIPDNVMSTWLRQAIAPALSIALMGKFGVMHPPAGASSVLLASGLFEWKHYGMLLLSTAISLLPAVIINNMSLKRQYPTHSWSEVFRVRP